MIPTLYKREREVLEYLSQYIQRHGYAPTLAEIAESMGVTAVSTVHEHLQKLVKKGFINKSVGFDRGIELVEHKVRFDSHKQAIELPVLGFIAAGSPLEPHTDPNFYLSVSVNLIGKNKMGYILQVKGKSMIDEGIMEGDFVIVQHQKEAQDGNLVVAILPNGLATLKKIYFEKNRIRLEPANAEMAPIYTTHVEIQGKVVAVLRRFSS